MAALQMRGLSGMTADRAFTISGVDLDVAGGEICALIGPSGSGKSTLLRLVAGLEQVTGGTIHLDADDVTTWPPERRDLAWLPQGNHLAPRRTVEATIAGGVRGRRRRRRDAAERVTAEARAAGLDHLLERRLGTLAAGERQAAGLARTAVRVPAAYLLDEPFVGIDPRERERLRGELGRLVRGLGVPVLLATNDLSDALALGDRLAILRDGELVQHGSTGDVHERPANAFVAGFVGDPAMNLLEGTLEPGARTTFVRLPGGAVPVVGVPAGLRTALDGRRVLLGVRPEHLDLGGKDPPLTGVVDAVERLGGSQVVHVRLGADVRAACTAAGSVRVRRGQRVGATPRRERLHLFDPASGLGLWHAQSHGTSR